jgi:hypothetical protein
MRIDVPFPTKAMNLLGADAALRTDSQFPTICSRCWPQPCPEHRDRSPDALPSFSHRGLSGSHYEGRGPSGCELHSQGDMSERLHPCRWFTIPDHSLAVVTATPFGTPELGFWRPTQLLLQGFTRFISRRSRTFWVRTGSIKDGIGADVMCPCGPIRPRGPKHLSKNSRDRSNIGAGSTQAMYSYSQSHGERKAITAETDPAERPHE